MKGPPKAIVLRATRVTPFPGSLHGALRVRRKGSWSEGGGGAQPRGPGRAEAATAASLGLPSPGTLTGRQHVSGEIAPTLPQRAGDSGPWTRLLPGRPGRGFLFGARELI